MEKRKYLCGGLSDSITSNSHRRSLVFRLLFLPAFVRQALYHCLFITNLSNMGDAGDSNVVHHGIVRYVVTDKSSKPEDRSLFGIAPNTSYAEHELEIRDYRKAEELVKGPEGLDVQGFAYVEHESALSKSDTWFTDRNLEEI